MARKNFPPDRNLEENQAQCRRPIAAAAWEGEGQEEKWGDAERDGSEQETERKMTEGEERQGGWRKH